MHDVAVIGLDLAKSVFQVHGVDRMGDVVTPKMLRRPQVLDFFRKLPSCLVGFEACGGAHYWAREIAACGHDVRMIPPIYVKAHVKRGKTDAADAAAICEAVARPTMRFVPIKTVEQQAAGMILKVRDLLVRQRTQIANAFRSHLSELGIVTAAGLSSLDKLAGIVRDLDTRHLIPRRPRAGAADGGRPAVGRLRPGGDHARDDRRGPHGPAGRGRAHERRDRAPAGSARAAGRRPAAHAAVID